jgi:hypothetical protein
LAHECLVLVEGVRMHQHHGHRPDARIVDRL